MEAWIEYEPHFIYLFFGDTPVCGLANRYNGTGWDWINPFSQVHLARLLLLMVHRTLVTHSAPIYNDVIMYPSSLTGCSSAPHSVYMDTKKGSNYFMFFHLHGHLLVLLLYSFERAGLRPPLEPPYYIIPTDGRQPVFDITFRVFWNISMCFT